MKYYSYTIIYLLPLEERSQRKNNSFKWTTQNNRSARFSKFEDMPNFQFFMAELQNFFEKYL